MTTSLFLDTAARIGYQLCRDALWDGERCNWLGASMEPVGAQWTVVQRAFGPELYSGTSGIALFLGRLYGLTGDRLYRQTALGAVRQALSRADAAIPPPMRPAFYAGHSGIAHVLLELGTAWDDATLVERGLRLFYDLSADTEPGDELDVISGPAGAIPALLRAYGQHRQEFLLDLATRLGDQLLAAAHRHDYGWSWGTVGIPVEHDLTGLAHGASGCAWSLAELWAVTRNAAYRTGAEAGFRYERHWFDPQQENWPDFRRNDDLPAAVSGTPVYGLAWCHGAPGIGLTRVRASVLLDDPALRHEAEAAMRATQASFGPPGMSGGWQNYSLCHGVGGNAELFILAGQVLPDPAARTVAEEVGRVGAGQYAQQNLPWPCGVMGGWETPNLMLGLAGIGYFYLRLHDPATVPSILLVHPP